jgi:cellulose biosynthesis protein BcsQ
MCHCVLVRVIAISAQKGRVGKTTGTVNLAARIAGWERSMLLADGDPRVQSEGLVATDPGNRRILAKYLEELSKGYDLTRRDTPLGVSRTSETVLVSDELTLVPVAPRAASADGLGELRACAEAIERTPKLVAFVDTRERVSQALLSTLEALRRKLGSRMTHA